MVGLLKDFVRYLLQMDMYRFQHMYIKASRLFQFVPMANDQILGFVLPLLNITFWRLLMLITYMGDEPSTNN